MTKQQRIIIAVLGVCVFAVCGLIGLMTLQTFRSASEPITIAAISTATAGPQNTSAPTMADQPTATRVMQDAPPTATRDMQMSAASSDLIALAWNKTAAAKAYRFEFIMTVSDPLGLATGMPSPNSFIFYDMTGLRNGKDRQAVLKGFVSNEFGGDATREYEAITVGDKLFMKGPIPSLGAMDNRWYTTDKTKSPIYLFTGDVFGPLDPKKDSSGLYKINAEKLDNQQCDVYSGDKAGLAKFLLDPDHQTPPGLNNVEIADMQFWVCNDGYLHQYVMSRPGVKIADSPNQIPFLRFQYRYQNCCTDKRGDYNWHANP